MRGALALVLLLGLAAPTAGWATDAPPQGDQAAALQERLAQTRRKIADAEKRERQLRSGIAAAKSERSKLQGDIAQLASELAALESEVAGSEADRARVDAELTTHSTELQAMQEALAQSSRDMRDRAVRVYKLGPASFLDYLMGAADFGELASRVHILGAIFDHDTERIRSIDAQRARVEEKVSAVSALRDLADAQVDLDAARRNEVASLKRTIDKRRTGLDTQIKAQTATLEEVQKDKASWLKEQSELERQSGLIKTFLKGRKVGGTAAVGRGGMMWPTSGQLSSNFGYRVHPIYGDKRFHAGIDIAAPSGQSVVAAAPGEVIFAGRRGGYGNAVIVDHGGDLATVYAHLSSIGAGEGTKVARGASVGRVGCTGSCTGPHLHFEVRVDGEPQNPLGWLP